MIYLLHFERPFKHAKHYLGSTTDIEKRLTAHARGNGANLTKVLFDCGEHWKLAALWEHDPSMTIRNAEREAKARHSGISFCPICREFPAQPPNTRPFNIPAGLEITSQKRREKCFRPNGYAKHKK